MVKKDTLNANTLIRISLIILYLLHFIPISKPKNLSLSLHHRSSTSMTKSTVEKKKKKS